MSDRTLASVGPERPVSGSRGRAFWSHDRTLGLIAPDAGLCPVKVDRTRPVEEIRLEELTGNDRTLGLQRLVS